MEEPRSSLLVGLQLFAIIATLDENLLPRRQYRNQLYYMPYILHAIKC